MLLFSTLLSVNEKMTEDDFIKLVIEWNQKSPYEKNIIRDMEWNGERNIRFGDDRLWLGIEELKNEENNIIAVRFEKTEDDGVIWDTDYVMNFTDRKLSVRLDRSYLEEALVMDREFSTPHFISMLIEKGYLNDDKDLKVLRTPEIITEEKLPLLASVINGEASYRLPVVYVSKTLLDKDPFDVEILAGRLKGVAHVFSEENQNLTYKLRKLCSDKNEYNGAIGIYFPAQAAGHKKFLNHSYYGSDRILMEKVIAAVISYSNSQMMPPLYTWSGVNNEILRERYSLQVKETQAERLEKEKAVYETDELLSGVDNELNDLKSRIAELTKENDALAVENHGLRNKLDSMSDIPLLVFGGEDEFFETEIKQIILETLEEALRASEAGTRRADVLGDIVRCNGGVNGESSLKAQKVKSMFKGYRNMSGTMKQYLNDIGFEITEDGKHYKLTYFGDSRYFTTVAKTPSDTRTGMNVAMQIIRNML